MHAPPDPSLNHTVWNPGAHELCMRQEAVTNVRPPTFPTGVTPGSPYRSGRGRVVSGVQTDASDEELALLGRLFRDPGTGRLQNTLCVSQQGRALVWGQDRWQWPGQGPAVAASVHMQAFQILALGEVGNGGHLAACS